MPYTDRLPKRILSREHAGARSDERPGGSYNGRVRRTPIIALGHACLSKAAVFGAACAALLLASSPVAAQDEQPSCRILCAPELKVEPTITTEHLFRRHRIDADGTVERVSRERAFELTFAVGVPTQIPRIGLTFEATFSPFGDTAVHPFTGVTASQAGRQSFRDNGVEIESEFNFYLFETSHTNGWLSSHVDMVDKFSPGETPNAGSAYTHKLNLEWDTAFHVFNRVQGAPWLRHVEVELSLDYVATGLPKAGDIIGNERFLDDASPWSLSMVFVFPLAPLNP